MKVIKIVNYLINIYDLLNSYDIKLKQLINPRPLYFNISNIYSENDTEDMELLFGNQQNTNDPLPLENLSKL